MFRLADMTIGETFVHTRVIHTTIKLLSGALALSGCATNHLRDMALNQGKTVTDFQYKMALDNLSMFRYDKDSLPWNLVLSNGTAQIDESVSPSFSYTWPAISRTLGLSASGGITVNWTITPTLNDEQLAALRMRYQTATRDPSFSADFDEGTLPKGEPFGHYRSLYVWPKPGHLGALVQLILSATHDVLIKPADEPGFVKPTEIPAGVALTPRR